MLMLNGKFSERLAQLGAPPQKPAEDEATRVREIKAAAHRLGASTNLAVAAITCGISSSMATIMFEAARTAKGAPGTFADTDSRARWDSDPALRGEFGSFERFAAGPRPRPLAG